jgi:hypothetical protein
MVRRVEEGGKEDEREEGGARLMMSRLSRVCHLARGRSVSVISSLSSCAGVLNTLVGRLWRGRRGLRVLVGIGSAKKPREYEGRRPDLLPRRYPAPRVSLLLRSVPARSPLRCGRRLPQTALCSPYGSILMSQSSLTQITMFTAYQRYTPTLSTCEVAKKSPVGEKVTLAATLAHRKPSRSLPVGMSNVRIVESREVAISQRESGENVCQAHNQQEGKSR